MVRESRISCKLFFIRHGMMLIRWEGDSRARTVSPESFRGRDVGLTPTRSDYFGMPPQTPWIQAFSLSFRPEFEKRIRLAIGWQTGHRRD